MALQQPQDTVRQTTPITPWQLHQGRWEFLDRRHDHPDPLAAAQHEARVLGQNNAHLAQRIETLEAEKAQIEAERVVAVKSAWFWWREARRARRSRRWLRTLMRREWLMVALCALIGVLALALFATAMGWM